MNKPTEEWTVQVVANLVFVNAPNRCVAITHNNSCEPSKQSLEDAEEICRLHNALTVPDDELPALCAAKDELLAGAIEDIEAAKQRRVLTEATLDRVQRERDELRKDKERLDWLEANLGYVMIKSKEEGKRHNLILCTPIRAGEPHPRTLRSAIDAALTPTP